jgi:hypothetical protein
MNPSVSALRNDPEGQLELIDYLWEGLTGGIEFRRGQMGWEANGPKGVSVAPTFREAVERARFGTYYNRGER